MSQRKTVVSLLSLTVVAVGLGIVIGTALAVVDECRHQPPRQIALGAPADEGVDHTIDYRCG